jgi:hypothetical protein
MTEAEQWTYDEAARPIKATSYEENTIENTMAIQRIAHKAGIRAVEERWERRYDETRNPLQKRQPPQQQKTQPRLSATIAVAVTGAPSLQASSWAQRTEAAAALPQTTQFQKVRRGGKAVKEPTGLELIKRVIP